MARLAGKVVVVTGAAGGLGRATALRCAGEGARLAITDVNPQGLAETAAMLVDRVGSDQAPVTFAGDITDAATIDRVVTDAVHAFGAIHGLCNVAGTLGTGGPLEGYAPADFDRVMHVNCMAQMLAIQRVLPEMRRAGGGSIVNVASVGALVALPFMAVYCASKAAVLGLTRAVALEVAPDIRCNAICPGGIDTPMAQTFLAQFPDREEMLGKLVGRQLIKRFAKPEELAEMLLFLVSDESSFVTGSVIAAEAGHTSW
jgi:NAD(P)-dependent dehydrogenase (short-subunit alcohol dehydrogenase family)